MGYMLPYDHHHPLKAHEVKKKKAGSLILSSINLFAHTKRELK